MKSNKKDWGIITHSINPKFEKQVRKETIDEICGLIDKTNWAKVFEKTTYSIDGKSVWGHDTECYEDWKDLSKDFADKIKEILKSAIRGDKIE